MPPRVLSHQAFDCIHFLSTRCGPTRYKRDMAPAIRVVYLPARIPEETQAGQVNRTWGPISPRGQGTQDSVTTVKLSGPVDWKGQGTRTRKRWPMGDVGGRVTSSSGHAETGVISLGGPFSVRTNRMCGRKTKPGPESGVLARPGAVPLCDRGDLPGSRAAAVGYLSTATYYPLTRGTWFPSLSYQHLPPAAEKALPAHVTGRL